MLRSLKDLYGYRVRASDGEAGSVEDFYFDDDDWRVRHVIVDLGSWLHERRVVVSSGAVSRPDWETKLLFADLTKEELQNSPAAAEIVPVSRQGDRMLQAEYATTIPGMEKEDRLVPASLPETPQGRIRVDGHQLDPHLRSSKEVLGYRIQSRDGQVGSVEDLIVDDELWAIRYVVVETAASLSRLPGKKVLISPVWIEAVTWEDKSVLVGLSRGTIHDSPGFDPAAPINREYEVRLYDYYGRPKYWI
ncbi:MAG: PRC-barrel domain-containing protein [Anaerolineae bacterium]|jgi:sporulation protein YlmC with PRC-barrel domain